MKMLMRNGYKLRAPEPEDLDAMYRFENEPTLWETSNPTGPYSRFYLKDYIATNRNDIYIDRQLRLMMVDDLDEVVGIVDLFRFEPFHNRAEVGIVIAPEHRGKGLGTLALQMLHEYAFGYLGLHQLHASALTGNRAAQALFRKTGYEMVATLKEWIRVGDSYSDVVVMQLVP